MQEKLRPTIKYFPQIIETSNKLLQARKTLDVPYVITEQYPKGDNRTNLLRNFEIISNRTRSNSLGIGYWRY